MIEQRLFLSVVLSMRARFRVGSVFYGLMGRSRVLVLGSAYGSTSGLKPISMTNFLNPIFRHITILIEYVQLSTIGNT